MRRASRQQSNMSAPPSSHRRARKATRRPFQKAKVSSPARRIRVVPFFASSSSSSTSSSSSILYIVLFNGGCLQTCIYMCSAAISKIVNVVFIQLRVSLRVGRMLRLTGNDSLCRLRRWIESALLPVSWKYFHAAGLHLLWKLAFSPSFSIKYCV